MDDEKILQIIPATGWGARYADEADAPLDPVICFALVEMTVDGETSCEVRPMGSDGKRIAFIDDASNFEGLEYRPGNLLSD